MELDTLLNTEPINIVEKYPRQVQLHKNTFFVKDRVDIRDDTVLPPGRYCMLEGSEIFAKDCRLSVFPGTTFYFANNSEIYITGGEFHAYGNERGLVRFLPYARRVIGRRKAANITLNETKSSLEHFIIKNLIGKDGRGPLALIDSKTEIKNGVVGGNRSLNRGGGLYISQGSAKIKNTKIKGNGAKFDGGGAYIVDADVVFEESDITKNIANMGGGIYITSSTLEMEKSALYKNLAYTSGGAIFIFDSNAELKAAEVTKNKAKYKGGAIYIFRKGLAKIDEHCLIEKNIPMLSSIPSLRAFSGGKIEIRPEE